MGSLILDKMCCRQIGYDLLQLLHFVEINSTGVRKILKKFDKRVGFHLGNQYIATRANHPYSQLQQMFRTVVRLPVICCLAYEMSRTQCHFSTLFCFGCLQAVLLLLPNQLTFIVLFAFGLQGLGAMVGTISRNLAELRHNSLERSSTSSTISLFRNASLPRRVVEQEPVIQVICLR